MPEYVTRTILPMIARYSLLRPTKQRKGLADTHRVRAPVMKMKLFGFIFLLVLLGTAYGRDCGKAITDASTRSHAKRIVQGNDTTTDKYPFVCSIYDNDLNQHICAGSILKGGAAAYILTTANCVRYHTDVQRYEVVCFADDLQGSPHSRVFATQSITLHDDFNTNSLSHDIALLELAVADPTDLDDLHPVCLPSEDPRPGDTGAVMGWGAIYFEGPSLGVLQERDMVFVDDQYCADRYNVFPGYFQPRSMICSHEERDRGGPCTQDGGAPFVVQRNGSFEVAAIVSWAYGCAHEYYPDVYTNIYFYLNWIRGKIPDVIL